MSIALYPPTQSLPPISIPNGSTLEMTINQVKTKLERIGNVDPVLSRELALLEQHLLEVLKMEINLSIQQLFISNQMDINNSLRVNVVEKQLQNLDFEEQQKVLLDEKKDLESKLLLNFAKSNKSSNTIVQQYSQPPTEIITLKKEYKLLAQKLSIYSDFYGQFGDLPDFLYFQYNTELDQLSFQEQVSVLESEIKSLREKIAKAIDIN